jgi:AbrB family looped-hinge helix DNA binding protein
MRQMIQLTFDGRGRVTLPAEVRKLLGITGRGRVFFVIEDERIAVRRDQYTLEEVYASGPPLPDGMDIDEAIREAKVDRADETMRRMREGTLWGSFKGSKYGRQSPE